MTRMEPSTKPFILMSECVEFRARAMSALDGLPIVGDPEAKRVIALAHYSADPSISRFKYSLGSSWTQKITDIQDGVISLTGLRGRVFKSLYVIRFGVSSTQRMNFHDNSLMAEHAICTALEPGQFARLDLILDASTGRYQI